MNNKRAAEGRASDAEENDRLNQAANKQQQKQNDAAHCGVACASSAPQRNAMVCPTNAQL